MVWQDLALCDNLSVVANLFLGGERLDHRMLDDRSMVAEARTLFARLHIPTEDLQRPVGLLSGGQRQLIAVPRTWRRESRRRASGLVAPPASLTIAKIVGMLVAGIVLVLICNTDRGRLVPIQGVPWVVLIVLGVLAMWTVLLGRTRFGRYMYAIGGNAEAARRAGVNLTTIRTTAFALCSLTAGIAGVVYASRLRSVSTALDGGTLVLYAVAAAVIGGTSLFGGRGKAVHAVLGGLVIAAIDNGMGLQGYSAAAKYVVTALVLLAAVTIDAVARRSPTTR